MTKYCCDLKTKNANHSFSDPIVPPRRSTGSFRLLVNLCRYIFCVYLQYAFPSSRGPVYPLASRYVYLFNLGVQFYLFLNFRRIDQLPSSWSKGRSSNSLSGLNLFSSLHKSYNILSCNSSFCVI